MNKELVGSHAIDIGTVILDNKTHLSYSITEIFSTGIKMKLISTVGENPELYCGYDYIENGFINSDISISGYEVSDSKILHLVINDLKVSMPGINKKIVQIGVDGSREVKKKIKKISLKGL